METLAWVFWGAVGLRAAYKIYVWSNMWNVNGAWGLTTPAGYVWIVQALGVGLVPLLGWSPWHLLWWIPASFVFSIVSGRILVLLGVHIF
jgi:hypothetical protein